MEIYFDGVRQPKMVWQVDFDTNAQDFVLTVYDDGSAVLSGWSFDGESMRNDFMRMIEPHEDGSDIAICGVTKEWFDRELAAGRSATRSREVT